MRVARTVRRSRDARVSFRCRFSSLRFRSFFSRRRRLPLLLLLLLLLPVLVLVESTFMVAVSSSNWNPFGTILQMSRPLQRSGRLHCSISMLPC